MAISVKDANGVEHNVASNGKTNTALGLSIGALGTALLGGGLNAILGGGITPAIANGSTRECLLDKDTFYAVLLQQANENATRDINTERRFANLESSIAINSTANQYQNTIIQNQFEWERILSEKNLALATCRCLQGDVYLSPTKLADNYIAPSRILDSYIPRDYLPGRGFYGGQCGAAFAGHDNSCAPCGGF